MRPSLAPLLAAITLSTPTFAADIEGVLPAALDQPRIYLAISVDAKSKPLEASVSGGGALANLLGGDKPSKKDGPVTQFAVEAFLDTGASGVLLSKSTADGLGLRPIVSGGKPVIFHDVGVAGGEQFPVGPAVFLRLSEYSSRTDGDDLADYAPPIGPIRLQLRESAGLIDQLTGGLDVAGMPVMAGKVMVLDARPLAKMDKLKTTLVAPGDKTIPKSDSVVPLTYVDYQRFNQIEPAAGPWPSLAANPMIGPNPFVKTDAAKPVTITHHGKTATLTMLLDSGAASSMISVAKAKALGVEVDDDGKLTNVPAKEQFTLPIGGIGGTKNVPGFYVDVLVLPTRSGEPIRYVKAPVLVLDITVEDARTKEPFTLDGVFGVNYLVASADITGSGDMAGIGDLHGGPFDFIVIDHANQTLGLTLSHAIAADADDAPAKRALPAPTARRSPAATQPSAGRAVRR